ncbi:MAG: hypothetical protein ACJA0I_000648 [Gammaproteobacteria bacterium]|jgi:hypothetical protein
MMCTAEGPVLYKHVEVVGEKRVAVKFTEQGIANCVVTT